MGAARPVLRPHFAAILRTARATLVSPSRARGTHAALPPGAPRAADAAAQTSAHFDHSYDAMLLDFSEGALPEPVPTTTPPDLVRQLGDGRIIELVLRKDTFELHEQTGTTLADMKKRQV